jgi:monovalent cation:proton antiporter-2 (CPA2) family protein
MEFLEEALVFLIAALVVVPIFMRLGLSAVLGYLVAGLAIGPGGLALTDGGTDGLLAFAEIGVVLLLFVIGLELQPKRLWLMRRAVFVLGNTQLVATTLVLAIALRALDVAWGSALMLGFAAAMSSTAFVLQLLGERKKLNRPHGRAAFGTLLMQDVAAIPVLATLSLMTPPGVQAAPARAADWLPAAVVVVGLAAARYALRPALRVVASTGINELFTAAALAIVVGAALAMEAAHLSMGLGAFAAGMMVADSQYRHQLETDVTPFKGLLLGLFFIAVGMSVDVSLLIAQPGLVLGLTLGLVAVKAAMLYPSARLYGLDHREAVRCALVLSQGGEFAFVLLTAAVAVGVLGTEHAHLAVLVVTASMVTTPFVVRIGERFLIEDAPTRRFDEIREPPRPVVIAGFGRFGQIVARVLSMRHIPFTALEANPTQVDFVRSFGNEIYYGDATRLDLLQAAHVHDARAFVIAVDDIEASMRIAELVRVSFPNVPVLARARNRYHELQLRELGVRFVIRETLLSSLALTTELLQHLGSSQAEARAAVETFRRHDAATLARQALVYKDENAFRQTSIQAAQELNALFNEDAARRDPKAREVAD